MSDEYTEKYKAHSRKNASGNCWSWRWHWYESEIGGIEADECCAGVGLLLLTANERFQAYNFVGCAAEHLALPVYHDNRIAVDDTRPSVAARD